MQLGFGEAKFAWVDAYQGGSALQFLKCRFSLEEIREKFQNTISLKS